MQNVFEIKYSPGDESLPREIAVGDLGLYLIKQIEGSWQLHYFPDGNAYPIDSKSKEYALRFLASIYHLIQYICENPHVLDLQEPLFFSTNARMYNFIQRNFPSTVLYESWPNNDCFEGSLTLAGNVQDASAFANLRQATELYSSSFVGESESQEVIEIS